MRTKRTQHVLAALLGALCLPWCTAQAQPATFGNALAFDGVNQYVSITNFGAIAPTNEVTVEFWAFAYALDEQAAFMLEPDDFTNRFLAHVSYISGDTFWDFGDASADGRLAYPNPSDTVSNWVHYALVASSADNTMRIYRNGVLDTSKVGMSPFVRGTYELRLGGDGGFFAFNGQLDDFRVWNTARSSDQIAANYNHTLAGNEPGLLLYYRFDAASGTVATNSATATGLGYNGTLANAPTWTNSGAPFLYFADGSTNVIDAITINVPNPVYVGSNGPNTTLLIINGGMLSNSGEGYIGREVGASTNRVVVTGSGSLWTNSGTFLRVGYDGSGNQLVVSNGGGVASSFGVVGYTAAASNNVAVVTGTGSLWTNRNDLRVGGSGNQLVVTNGGVVASRWSYIGYSANGNNSQVTVTGANSQWRTMFDIDVGDDANTNSQLVIRDGGLVTSLSGRIGDPISANWHTVFVTDAGSMWSNSASLSVGNRGSWNQLIVTNGGTVRASNAYVGFNASSTNNRVTVDGGNLIVTNSGGAGTLDVRRGTNVLNAGIVQADNLLLTNGTSSRFELNGGTLITRGSTVNNGLPLVVGNGSSAATYQLIGNGLHTFNDGLVISTAATLTGNGTVAGSLTVQPGGNLSPSARVGLLVLSNSPVLQGSVLMEINKKGVNRTNNQIQVAGSLTYGGNLVVSKIGFDDLAIGDSFQLFSATSYSGAFTGMSLPPPGPGLMWDNKLLIDGSIVVVAQPQISISGVVQSGTNLVFDVSGGSPGGAYTLLSSTNVMLPLSSWATNSTGFFDALGGSTLTRGINSDEAHRYYKVRVP